MSFGKYLKSAFVYHWNLLALAGGMGFALLSGKPDVAVPIVLAAEIGYLGLLAGNPKFQKYVEVQESRAARGESSETADQTLRGILNALPKPAIKRFESLRTRCRELRQIALDLKAPGQRVNDAQLDDLQLSGLDRLLWIYLRLLFTEYSLGRFFETTDEKSIRDDIREVEQRIRTASASSSSNRDRLVESLQDNLRTCQDRLANYQKARENHELVQLEIGRLESKIRSLSELAVNRQEPEFISGQVSSVAESMMQTERTINDLQFVTGLGSGDDHVPELVRRETVSSRN